MPREPHIPLFLWIATAFLVHISGYKGADQVSEVLGDRLEVQRFADEVRRHVISANRPMEVALLDEKDVPLPPEEAKPDNSEPTDETGPPQETPPDKVEPNPVKPKDDPHPKPVEEQKKPEKEPDKPKLEKPKEPEQKKEDDKPKQDFPAMKVPNRIAVQQHVEDKNQEDNPNAEFIGDEANHVKEQTQARITATDQNDPDPNPGTTQEGPTSEPGNAHVNDVAHSDDSPGEAAHAPNEQAAGAKATASVEPRESGASKSIREVAPNSRHGVATGDERGAKEARNGAKAEPERLAAAGARATPASPEVAAARESADGLPPAAEASAARAAQTAKHKQLPPMRGKEDALDFLGLGASGRTAGGINLNLTPGAALAAVGRDQLGRERIADGERRRSKHRGSWRTVGMERWRPAIENYNSSVKPGNQTALNTAKVPFATYLNQIHNRLHPIFADSFLASLDSLPADSPLNKPEMRTNLEIVLDKDEGKIVKMGVTRSSGSTMFDVAALESVQNAAPFGKPPPIIVSPDGKVYLHWEFYRNPFYACSTYFAHPYLLKAAPESAPPKLPPPSSPPFGPREETVPRRGDLGSLTPESKHGTVSRLP
jgi:TonB family protein